MALMIQVHADADGSWSVAVGDGSTKPTRSRVDAEAARRLAKQVQDGMKDSAVVYIPGRDAARTQREEAVGRLLSEFVSDTAVAARVGRCLGATEASVSVAILDVSDAVGRSLPWELLAATSDGQALEVGESMVVARLVPGRPPLPPATAHGIRVLSWCPTPEDPACAALLDRLNRTCQSSGLAMPQRLHPRDARLPAPRDDYADILHIVCHGGLVGGQGALLIGSGDQAVGTTAHLLSDGLPRLALVVLDVCEGGHVTADDLANLAGRLVATGAAACVAPLAAASVDALSLFSTGLYESLVKGATVGASVRAGRRTVRGLSHPAPPSRWNNLAFYVGDVSAAQRVVAPASWMPDGWPRPAPDAAGVLDEALSMADAEGSNHVGVEHVLRALSSSTSGGPATHQLRGQLRPVDPRLWSGLRESVRPIKGMPAERGGTPRLRDWGRALRPGFTLDDVAVAATADPGSGLRLVAPGSAGVVVPTLSSQATWNVAGQVKAAPEPQIDQSGPANALELVWGARDGLVIVPEASQVLGRPLRDDSPSMDWMLSRSHLTWLAEGRIELHRRAKLRRPNAPTRDLPAGAVEISVGDVLELTPATWLRVTTRS